MKKILWLSHLMPYPPFGGVQQRSYNLIKEVSKYHKVTLLAFNQKALIDNNSLLEEAVSHFSGFCHVEKVVHIESDKSFFNKLMLVLKGLLPTKTYTVEWLMAKSFSDAFDSLLAREKFDVIHVDTLSLIPYLKNTSDSKLVLNHHNVESLMMLRRAENEKNLLKKFYFWQEGVKLKRYEAKVCKRFDLNITCSSLDTERLLGITGKINCIDVPNGVDLSYFTPVNSDVIKKSLVFAGGLSWYPNLDAMSFFLKKVWPLLVDKIPGVTMTVIGRHPPKWMLDMQDHYEGLTVTGFVDDVRPYLARAHIYVCPIRDGGGTKLKVLDALASNKPLVSDPIACEGIDVVDNYSVVFATDPDEYVSAIQKLISDESLCNQIADNGRRLIEHCYSFESLGQKLSNAYNQL